MSVSILSERITPDIYNSLEHISKASEHINSIEPFLLEIKDIFDKHDAHEIFSIHLLHKHFDIEEGKIYVYRNVGEIEVCDQTSETDIHGHVYIVNDDHSIQAYEYKTGKGPDISNYKEFLSKLVKFMVKNKLNKFFSITVNENKHEEVMREFELENKRTVLIPDKLCAKMADNVVHVPTDWNFDPVDSTQSCAKTINTGNHSVYWSNCDAKSGTLGLVDLANNCRFDLIDEICKKEKVDVENITRITRNPASNTCLVNSTIVIKVVKTPLEKLEEIERLCRYLREKSTKFIIEEIITVGEIFGHGYMISKYLPYRNMEHMSIDQWKTKSEQIRELLKFLDGAGIPHEDMSSKAICHGDINPANVLVDENEDVKALIDWECVSIKEKGFEMEWMRTESGNIFAI